MKEDRYMKRKMCAAAVACVILAVLVAGCELSGSETARKNLARPYISVQPESWSFYTDNYTAPTLKVEIYDWEGGDGSISYQWYSFKNIDEYCEKGGERINGATRSTYTPEVTPAAGEKFYFYVVVTNSKSDALDVTSATLQSDVATIAFSAPGDPLFPVISRHPANATYGWGRPLNALKVEARLARNAAGDIPEGSTLTYQWYVNGSRSVTNGTPEASADKSTFIPSYAELQMGPNFYFVEVTNTIGTKTAVALGIPAIVDMKPGLRAATPRIINQPVDRFFFTGSASPTLTVVAESPDGGDAALSYQWYSNPDYASASTINKVGVKVEGATSASFTPAANGFYYVEVTNTNLYVTPENQTATVNSRTVQVRSAAYGAPASNANVKIPDNIFNADRVSVNRDSENLRQYVRGYGGMHVAWDSFPPLFKEDTELMYNPEKMGYNILRIMIRPDNIDIKKTMAELTAKAQYADYYENVKIVNKYGGYVAASPWTPPKEWKSNNSINGGGNLIPAYYRLFANYLRTFAQHMYDQGAPIYTISISNEPNYVAGYDGCEWSPQEMRNFWIEIGRFTEGIRGFGGGRELPYVLTMNGESANTPFINNMALQDPRSKAVIDLLARHIYGSRTDSLWNSNKELLRRPDGSLTEVWMTEHNINSANPTGYYNDSSWDYVWRYLNDVDLVMRINNENAFVWWASKRFYSMIGDNQFGTTGSTLEENKGRPSNPLPRGWALTHYARYTIDTTRIYLPNNSITGTFEDTTPIGNIERATSLLNNTQDDMDNVSVRVTAYVSQDGKEISMVMFTPTQPSGSGGRSLGTVKIDMPAGFEINGVQAHRSSNESYFRPDDTVVISQDKRSAYVTLPRSNLVSVKFTR
jgi:O-glycosyl hydrolase